ncbi:carboxypeptidase-like regulatory domain-containing protein [Methanobrevibacter sp. YE315]|uniref:carboxypeptidase-like regulatory domain-containing protein n=1 Tax=Methanobrevibacter sp. YE315 TaxID=1609968 RepID=UPI000829E3B5|nr:carboxypeptidase-like regulatory domain-containing protein [Methanobrevibacter sp. YE315]
MDNNKLIIIVLIAIIAILLVGIVAMVPNFTKQDTNLVFKGNATLNQGDSIKIILTDANGNPIANQNVNITITDKDRVSDFHSVVTSANGEGTFKLDKDPGDYEITVSYGGNDKCNGCNATQKFTVKEKEEATATQSGPTPYAYKSDGTPMYSQAEVDQYMLGKYGMVNYHVGGNGYIDMDEPGYDDAGHRIGR